MMRGTLILGGALLAACLWPGAACRADTQLAEGASLTLVTNMENDTSIEPDSSLHGQVRIVSAGEPCARVSSAGGGVVVDTAACNADAGALTLLVPTDMPLRLTSSGSGDVTIGDLQGPIDATVQSSGDLKLGRVRILQLRLRGSADVTGEAIGGAADIETEGSGTIKFGRVEGALRVSLRGSGDLSIGTAQIPALDVQSQGSGDLLVSNGSVGALRVRLAGSGDVTINGSASAADLQAEGGGDIHVARASGPVRRQASGGSDITIGEQGDAGIDADALRQLKQAFGSGAVTTVMTQTHDGHSAVYVLGHVIAGLIVLGLLIAVARIVLRNRGAGGVPGMRRRAAAPAAPTNPGVIAVCEKLAQIDARLARVEMHVMSREFELNRQFRQMDAGGGHG